MKTRLYLFALGIGVSTILGSVIGSILRVVGAEERRSEYGAIDVLVTTNFTGVTFAPIPCRHPGCAEGHHSFTATERYQVVRDTWANIVDASGIPTGENKRIFSDTNDWGQLSFELAHPSVYRMHTLPGWPVRPGTRWPEDKPPLPPWERQSSVAVPRRSNAAMLPGDTNNLYGVLYNVGGGVIERRGTDRLSNVRVFPGDAVETVAWKNRSPLITRAPTDGIIAWSTSSNTVERATNQYPQPTTDHRATWIQPNSLVFTTNAFDVRMTFSTNYPNHVEMTFHAKDGTKWKPLWWTEEKFLRLVEAVEASESIRGDLTNVSAAQPHRFRATPATNALPQAHRFAP